MPKVKRNRKIRTCEYCYHHKLKCDRNTPCSTCLRTKSECVYQFKSNNDSDNILTEEPKKKAQKSHIVTKKTAPSLEPASPEEDNVIKWRKEDGKLSIEETNSDVIFSTNINNIPLYYSRAFFPYLEPSLNRMFLFKMSEIGERGFMNDFSHVGTYDFQRFGFKNSLEQLVKEYPKKEEFDDIIYIYWDSIHPLVPVIDKEQTMVRYIRFWNELENETNPRFDIDSGVLFLAMLLAVKTAFEVNITDPEQVKKSLIEKNKIFDTFEKFKLFFGFKTNPNISYVQASIILYSTSAIYFIGLFTYTAALARQAEFMGLHRDPLLHDVYPNKNNTKDVEIRRTVWHFVRYLDTSTSVVSGMSPHMIMTNASTKFPSKHEYNSETGKFDGDINPFMVFTISRFKCSLVMETISHYLNSDFSSDTEKLLRWEGISRTVIALYQDVFTLVKEILSCSNNPKYSQNLLRFLISNAITNVHRTYLLHRACDRRPYSHHNRVILKPANAANVELTKLSQASSSKDFFEKVLTIRMPYYESTMEVSILLLYESRYRFKLTPELEKFRWFSKNANPLQYTFFVLRDLYHYPDKRYTFTHIPQDIRNFIIDEEVLKFEGDIRRDVVDITITNLISLKDYWCEPLNDVMNFLCELKKYVYKSIDKRAEAARSEKDESTSDGTKQNTDGASSSLPNKHDNHADIDPDNLNDEFELDKYKNILDLLSSFAVIGSSSSNNHSSNDGSQLSNNLDPLNDSSTSSASGMIAPTILNNQPITSVHLDNSRFIFNVEDQTEQLGTTANSKSGSAAAPPQQDVSMSSHHSVQTSALGTSQAPPQPDQNAVSPSTAPASMVPIPANIGNIDYTLPQFTTDIYPQQPGLSAIPSFDPAMYYAMNANTPLMAQGNPYGSQMYSGAPTPGTQMSIQQTHPLQQPVTQQPQHMQAMSHMQQYPQLSSIPQYQPDMYHNPSPMPQMHTNTMLPPHMQGNSPYMPHDNVMNQSNGTMNNIYGNTNQQTYR